MPQLLDGVWVNDAVAANEMKDGAFHREPTRFRNWLTADGGPGPEGQPGLKAEAGRYHLFISWLCPWASRTALMRRLKGLEGLIGLSVAGPVIGEDGWTFAEDQPTGPGRPAIRHLHQLYTLSEPRYSGKVSVPVLWDMQEGRIVNNESADIIRMINTAFDGIGANRLDFYPEDLRATIDHWNGLVYEHVNNGVYKTGFAATQEQYEAGVTALFAMLDRLEDHLADHRYLAGSWFTEADIRLFVTLVRFDAAYVGAFKCNIRRLADYPNLSGYMREIHQMPGVADTVRIEAIKNGYFSIRHINPTGIVPLGPVLDFASPHGRDHLASHGIRGA